MFQMSHRLIELRASSSSAQRIKGPRRVRSSLADLLDSPFGFFEVVWKAKHVRIQRSFASLRPKPRLNFGVTVEAWGSKGGTEVSKEVCQLLVAIVVHGFVETASRVASSCRYAKRSLILLFAHVVAHGPSANKSLQVTFDPPAAFAIAKATVASNPPELRR